LLLVTINFFRLPDKQLYLIVYPNLHIFYVITTKFIGLYNNFWIFFDILMQNKINFCQKISEIKKDRLRITDLNKLAYNLYQILCIVLLIFYLLDRKTWTWLFCYFARKRLNFYLFSFIWRCSKMHMNSKFLNQYAFQCIIFKIIYFIVTNDVSMVAKSNSLLRSEKRSIS